MSKKVKRGRPLAGDKPIDDRVYLRAPKADRVKWNKAAKKAKVKFSAWARSRLNSAAADELGG